MSTALAQIKPVEQLVKQTFADQYGEKAAAKLRTELSFIEMIMNRKDSKGRPSPLLKCTPESIGNAIKSAANMDLSFDPVLGHLSFLSFGGVATLDPSYKGRVFFLTREGVIKRVAACDTVCSNDTFRDNGINQLPTHKREVFKDRGKAVTAYCYLETTDGKLHGKILAQDEIEKRKQLARGKSRDKKSLGVFWGDPYNYKKMLMKTAIREACYGLPFGPALALLQDVDNQHFDLSSYELTDDRKKEIEDMFKDATTNAELNKIYKSLPKIEQEFHAVVVMGQEARERIKNTVQV